MKISFEGRSVLVTGAAWHRPGIVRGFLDNGAEDHAVRRLGDELAAFAQAIQANDHGADRLSRTIDLGARGPRSMR